MVNFNIKSLFVFVVLMITAAQAGTATGDWPEFRGPTGQGIAKDANPPTNWNQTQNIAWKSPIPGLGWSSPVLYKNSIYLTSAIVSKDHKPTSLRVLRIDVKDGSIVWDREVFIPENPHKKHDKNSFASPTPIAKDSQIYVHFGHMGTACLDVDGNILWQQTKLPYDPYHGNGGSPILYEDKLIFSCDGAEDTFIVALNKKTGDIIWKVNRTGIRAKNKFSFSTPLIVNTNGRDEIISPASGIVAAYNPDNGKEIWRVDYDQGFSVIPRPIHGHGMVFIGTGFSTSYLYAIRLGGKGDVTNTHVAWKTKKAVPKTPSMLLIGKELYYIADNGTVNCVDAITGDSYWQHKLGEKFSASPVFADNRIYVISEKGKTFVLKAGTTFEMLAENDLKQRTLASPAVSGSAIFIRTESHLYRIEKSR